MMLKSPCTPLYVLSIKGLQYFVSLFSVKDNNVFGICIHPFSNGCRTYKDFISL